MPAILKRFFHSVNDEHVDALKSRNAIARSGCKRGIKMQSIASVCAAVVKNSKIREAGNKSLVRT